MLLRHTDILDLPGAEEMGTDVSSGLQDCNGVPTKSIEKSAWLNAITLQFKKPELSVLEKDSQDTGHQLQGTWLRSRGTNITPSFPSSTP